MPPPVTNIGLLSGDCNAEVTAPIREDEQANRLRRKVGEQVLGYLLPNGT
jgi:hypothetical protein